ncbi:hypothetical protein KEM54_001002 [Ascosphaera aggregata]|nr:hypothetical protein KEM54_001002 [Ascosphaera aggregata]
MEKKFLCEHPGCGRSYLRREHLTRHTRVHQKNADLLTAHLRRHEKRGHTASITSSAAIAKEKVPVTVQLVPGVGNGCESPPTASNERSPATVFSQNVIGTSNRPHAVAPPAVLTEAALPSLVTSQFPLPSTVYQPAMQQDQPMSDANTKSIAAPLSRASEPLAAPVGLYYTANAQDNAMATMGPVAAPVASSTSLAPFVAQAGTPLFQPAFNWLFPQSSIFDMPSDDFLDMHLGALQASSPV